MQIKQYMTVHPVGSPDQPIEQVVQLNTVLSCRAG
jgi:hypothetical protein